MLEVAKRWLPAILMAVALALAVKGGTAFANVAPGGGGGGGGTVSCTTTTKLSGRTSSFCSKMPANAVNVVATATPSGNAVCSYQVPVTTTHCTTSCPSGTHLSGNTCVSNTTSPPSGTTCTGSTTHFLGCDGQYHSGYYDQTNSCGQITVAKYTSYAGGCTATACTPTGGNTTHFLGCDGTCKSGYFDQTNSCGQVTVAKYTSTANGCTSTSDGCAAAPTSCTPKGGNTTHFLGCDGTCKSGYFDQTNSCGTVTVAKYTSTANGCTTTADGCSAAPTTCTPTGGNTTHFLGCDGTCKSGYFDQTNSCGTVTVAQYASTANGCTTTADGCSSTTPPSGTQCPSGYTLVNGVCTPPTAACTAPQNSSTANGPYITGCASRGEYSTITYHTQVLWSCPGPTAHTHTWSTTGTQATSDCQPVIRVDGTKPLACAAAPDTGSAWSTYTYNNCLSYLGNKVDCGPTLTYTPTKPYAVQTGQFPEPVYNPVACPVPIAVGP